MRQTARFKLLAILFITYIVVAFGWWSTLLYRRTTELYSLKIENSQFSNNESLANSFLNELNQQKTMILSEGILLILCFLGLIVLFWFSYQKSIASTKQENNFLLSTTHELKSPLASIRLILETFVKRDLSSDRIKKFSTSALKESNRLEYLVNNMLLATKLEGHFELNKSKIDIIAKVENVIRLLEIQYPDRVVVFENTQKELFAMLDDHGFVSIVRNLIENAIKYSPSVKPVLVNVLSKNQKVVVEVKDEGVGLTVDQKKKVVEKFYRVEDENTRSTKGTGLGLFIVKEIVKAHEGVLKIIDNQPSGSIFKVILPK